MPNGSMLYLSISEKLINQVQQIAIECGYVANIRGKNGTCFVLSIRKAVRSIKGRKLDKVPRLDRSAISTFGYEGYVYCASVPNETLITRRNGVVAITGNSTLVTESPFVQGRMADMRVRSGRLKKLFFNVIKLACSLTGKDFERDVRPGLEIGMTEPDIVSRDPKAMTEALVAQAAQGWVDDKTAISELGRDYDTIKKNLDEQIEATGGSMIGGSATMGSVSRQQWKRNSAAIKDIKKALANGEYTAPHAKVLMTSLGFSGAQADKTNILAKCAVILCHAASLDRRN